MGKNSKISELLAPNRMVGADFKIIGKKIGAGNFGEVHIGENVKTKDRVAVKIEERTGSKGARAVVSLRHEYEMLRKLYHGYPKGYKINGIPRLFYFGQCGSTDCLVIELLGANLEDLFEICNHSFSMKTVLMIAFQLLDRIEQVHQRGIVYRDVKPENFLLGRKDTKESNIIHLVDFGLATFYRDPKTGKHLPYRDTKTMTGTARYMSIHSHFGKLQSRRDDLESIGYVLIYFAKGRLPWQGYKANNVKEKYKKIRDIKLSVSTTELCKELPVQFKTYMSYVRALGFSDEPDYEYLKDLFHSLYEELKFSYADTRFDWSSMNLPTDVQKYNRVNKFGESRVSSVDTEASQQLNDDSSSGDGTDSLTSLRRQTNAMDHFISSCKNVKSMSVCASNSNIAKRLIGDQGNESYTYSQGYFSNSDYDFQAIQQCSGTSSMEKTSLKKANGTTNKGIMTKGRRSSAILENENENAMNPSECSKKVREDIHNDISNGPNIIADKDEYDSEEEKTASFLCFKWTRRKKCHM